MFSSKFPVSFFVSRKFPRALLLVILVALCPFRSVLAETPSVTAVLSNSEVSVGETVRLQIRVMGSRSAEAPQTIDVDGLQIHRTGTSQRFELNNTNMSSSVLYDYTVLPQRPGTFKIPPQTIRIGNTSLRTPELKLNVVDSPNSSARSAQKSPNAQAAPGKAAFAELIVPKTSAYVGEIVPVVIRLGFYTRGRAQLADPPALTGQGFTVQKLQPPDQSQREVIDGQTYDVLTFKTAIAAARPGKFEIGPVEAGALVVVPRRPSNSRSRSPFDLFNLDDPFSDPFFADPFSTFGQREKVVVKSQPVAIEIKPLPANAPSSFSGAVGNFTMGVDANPKSVQVGDPITVTATISGRGNFDRVNAPVLEDERGWHKYPPSGKFKQDDDVGISGAKAFETVLSPNEKKQTLSPFAFSFFDPLKEQYVTLRSEAIPIRVEGGAAPALGAAAVQSGSATPATAAATAKETPKPQDILYQLTDRPSHPQSFTPLYARSSFWLVQVVPFLGLLGFVGWKIRQARMDNRDARRLAALHHESAELMRRLRRDDVSPQEYFSQASRAVQLKTALARNIDPNAVDVDAATAAFQLDENAREQLRQLFEHSDELRYSGARNGIEIVSPDSRRQVLDLIENLRT